MKHFSLFPLFQSHLDLAHTYWKAIIKPGDIVIDATCGNGHDTLVLALLAIHEEKEGTLIAIDNQPQALESAKKRLSSQLSENQMKHILFINQCHSTFPINLNKESVTLIAYNLGYLPGGNKALTTMSETTHESLKAALPLIRHGGAICITCYPGHEEGKREEDVVKEFARSLDPREWSCCYHSWINRQNAPSLLIIQKALRLPH